MVTEAMKYHDECVQRLLTLMRMCKNIHDPDDSGVESRATQSTLDSMLNSDTLKNDPIFRYYRKHEDITAFVPKGGSGLPNRMVVFDQITREDEDSFMDWIYYVDKHNRMMEKYAGKGELQVYLVFGSHYISTLRAFNEALNAGEIKMKIPECWQFQDSNSKLFKRQKRLRKEHPGPVEFVEFDNEDRFGFKKDEGQPFYQVYPKQLDAMSLTDYLKNMGFPEDIELGRPIHYRDECENKMADKYIEKLISQNRY